MERTEEIINSEIELIQKMIGQENVRHATFLNWANSEIARRLVEKEDLNSLLKI